MPQLGKQPFETDAEYDLKTEEYTTVLRQVTAMCVVCQVKMEDCQKAIEGTYGLSWDKEWVNLFNAFEAVGHKLEVFHKEIKDNSTR